jgi:hypothetical protein
LLLLLFTVLLVGDSVGRLIAVFGKSVGLPIDVFGKSVGRPIDVLGKSVGRLIAVLGKDSALLNFEAKEEFAVWRVEVVLGEVLAFILELWVDTLASDL